MTRIGWRGVLPSVTTQFREDFSLDLPRPAETVAWASDLPLAPE
jgi:hypothetical protein